jgi:hypothetical protein
MKKLTAFFSKMAAVGVVHATQLDLSPRGQFKGLEGIQVGGIVPAVLTILMIAGSLAGMIFLIIGGIRWITSGGDKAQVESARGTVTSALIGLAVVFAAWALYRLIQFFFGIDTMVFRIPTFFSGGSGGVPAVPTPI